MAEYPFLDELYAEAMTAIDNNENVVFEMCRQQGQSLLLKRIIESLKDREMDVAVVSTSRDHAHEVVDGINLPADGPLRVCVLSNHGPEQNVDDGEFEEFDLVLMDNAYHMIDDTVATVTAGYRYLGVTMPRIDNPPEMHNLSRRIDARYCDDDDNIIDNRVPPWILV